MENGKSYIRAEKDFINKWNTSFINTFKWKELNNSTLRRDYFLKKIDISAPWHPIIFCNKLNNISEFIEESKVNFLEPFYFFMFVPEKSFEEKHLKKLFKENILAHYIFIENKSIKELFDKYKSRVRTKIRRGFKNFKFIKLNSIEELSNYEIEIRNLLINQYLRLGSPCPPFELIKNLFKNKALNLYIVKFKNKLVGFITMSTDKNISHVLWTVKSNNFKNNDLSICLFQFCLEEAIKNKSKVFSLGTTNSKNLSKFKEQLNAERAIYFKKKFNGSNQSLKLFSYVKSNRNKFFLLINNIIIRLTILLKSVRSFEIISKEIWKRFD